MNTRHWLRAELAAGRTVWAPGCYDALSARIAAQAGFDAILATGYGIAASHLGAPDLGLYTMTEILACTRAMVAAVPGTAVIADCDTGYGGLLNVMRTVREFEAAGVAALLLEDQQEPKRCPAMTDSTALIAVEEGAARIRAAVEARTDPGLVIIARTDARTEAEAAHRLAAYAAAGADVVHAISSCCDTLDGLRRVAAAAGRPLSVPVLGWLEQQPAEDVASVAAIAHLPFAPLLAAAEALRRDLHALARTKRAWDVPGPAMDAAAFKRLIGFPELEATQTRLLTSASKAAAPKAAAPEAVQ